MQGRLLIKILILRCCSYHVFGTSAWVRKSVDMTNTIGLRHLIGHSALQFPSFLSTRWTAQFCACCCILLPPRFYWCKMHEEFRRKSIAFHVFFSLRLHSSDTVSCCFCDSAQKRTAQKLSC